MNIFHPIFSSICQILSSTSAYPSLDCILYIDGMGAIHGLETSWERKGQRSVCNMIDDGANSNTCCAVGIVQSWSGDCGLQKALILPLSHLSCPSSPHRFLNGSVGPDLFFYLRKKMWYEKIQLLRQVKPLTK